MRLGKKRVSFSQQTIKMKIHIPFAEGGKKERTGRGSNGEEGTDEPLNSTDSTISSFYTGTKTHTRYPSGPTCGINNDCFIVKLSKSNFNYSGGQTTFGTFLCYTVEHPFFFLSFFLTSPQFHRPRHTLPVKNFSCNRHKSLKKES